MQILQGILGFIITIGILVTIHEYGHFVVARFFNVKILRFSIGFGKPIWTWRGKRDGTLYTLAPIPLGGFVQMLGEREDEEIAEEDKMRTFKAQSPWKRFLIAFAGPGVNLLFAVLVFSLLFITGVRDLRPEIAYIKADSPAALAGLRVGDEILSINGKKTPLFPDALQGLLNAPNGPFQITVARGLRDIPVTLDFSNRKAGDEFDLGRFSGMYLFGDWLPAVVHRVLEQSAAEKMGLKEGDRIIACDGEDADIIRLSRILQKKPNQPIVLSILREGQVLNLKGKLSEREVEGEKIGFLGVEWQRLQFEDYQRTERYGVATSFVKGVEKTVFYVKSTYLMFARLIKHEVSIKNLGGPILIGDISGKAMRFGLEIFLNFLGLISLSLAAINLLPIPVLDGGHMLLSLIEGIRGKPMTEMTTEWLYRIGASIVFGFMALVIIQDLNRYL